MKHALEQPSTPTQRKVVAAYCISSHRLAIEIGQCSTIPISMDNGLCDFCSHNVVGTYAHFCVEVPPLYNSTKDKFQSLFENVVC